MKKSLLFALVGFMLFAFASCGGSDNSDSKDGAKTEKVTGTKEYKDAKKANNKLKKALNDAKDCDDLTKALDDAFNAETPKYNDDEKMTDDEKAKITKAAEDVAKVIADKMKELKCNY